MTTGIILAQKTIVFKLFYHAVSVIMRNNWCQTKIIVVLWE